MTDSRPSKRARCTTGTSGDPLAEEPTAGYQRSDAFWLRDGNIILVAEKVAFRVHQSVLERKSEVFKDIFGLPQPENAETESLEECPLVHVSDAAEDIRHLLSVLYDGDRVLGRKSPINMKMVFALLQLAIKYEIDYLRDEAISMLQTIYSPSYDEYVEQHGEDSVFPVQVTDRRDDQDPIIVINLAWKHGLHSLLPGAFFACAKLSNKDLARATKGSLREDDLTRLSDEDLERCLNGRATLQSKYFNRFRSARMREVASTCPGNSGCETKLENFWDDLVVFGMEDIFNSRFDPLEEVNWEGFFLFCDACRAFHESQDLVHRMHMYRGLADTFDLKRFLQGDSDAQAAD
ncbi:hypothetical protein EIP91_005091 [Steccherinum ochraceum]|uniref:BTB domain-containing protein n=1 Tax=Steccherinum ochraceum TaxID=92696 RepID=A0A4R0RAA8_9APHY|nr:hypothetical protein EIP91_005091 [Steccherinum ochraceum]